MKKLLSTTAIVGGVMAFGLAATAQADTITVVSWGGAYSRQRDLGFGRR